MRIRELRVRNFRLLSNVSLLLEDRTTVIVGRNNSGKTSITELFKRLLSDSSPKFRLEDFSQSVYEEFWSALRLREGGEDTLAVKEALPFIEVNVLIEYEELIADLGALGEFIVDLNPDSTDVSIIIRYQLEDGKLDRLFENLPDDLDLESEDVRHRVGVFALLKERIPLYFKTSLWAVDPQDEGNRKLVDWSRVQSLLQSGFINAQRGLDDNTHKEKDVLGKIVEALFNSANREAATDADRVIAQNLENTVRDLQANFDTNFNQQLTGLMPTFNLFGYPGLSDPGIRSETTLDIETLMKNHTKVRYTGLNGISLPESYNGLGARNLIFILFKLYEFFKDFQNKQTSPGLHLVFIEEPEAHLHPQMQEVFIRQLERIADIFERQFNEGNPWPVQFVVSTHSSHISNAAPFTAIRYFLTSENDRHERFTRVKDLRRGFEGEIDGDDRDFLHQYMTLTSCDLFFADKAILIEGASERIMLPKIIEKEDQGLGEDEVNLGSQYLSSMEVGGAYAHRFFGLMNFLELKTLVVTDLDSVRQNENNRWVKCKVSEGARTSNGCLKSLFEENITPAELIAKTSQEKESGRIRVAFQVPEEGSELCGRSFEEAFMLANSEEFELPNADAEKSDMAWEEAGKVEKTNFALKYSIERLNWSTPKYIKDGLAWLRENRQAN